MHKFCTSSQQSSLKDAQQFVAQMAVISVTLPCSILGSTCTRSPWGKIFLAAKQQKVNRPQLIEARIFWVQGGGRRQEAKVLSPASIPREFWLDRTFGFRMPSRDAPSDGRSDGRSNGRFQILHPGKDFLADRID